MHSLGISAALKVSFPANYRSIVLVVHVYYKGGLILLSGLPERSGSMDAIGYPWSLCVANNL